MEAVATATPVAAETATAENTTAEVTTATAPVVEAQDWKQTLDPTIKDHACLQSFKTYGDLAKSYVNVQPLIGLEKLPMPPKDAKPEVREKFMNDVYDRLGRPKDAKEYKLTNPQGVDLKLAPDAEQGLRAQAHKLGLLPHQLDGLYQWYMSDTANRVKLQKENEVKKINDVTAELRSEWGSAFEAKKNVAEKVLDKFATPEERAHLVEKGFNNDPKIIRMLAKIGESISDDGFAKGNVEMTMTPQEAKREIPKVKDQLNNMQQSHPEYKDLLKRKRDLYEMAFGQG
jgi:hypothetical protein